MDFGYHQAFGEAGHEAYETLLLDCMLGDATLFTRSDEVEAAWSVVDPIIEHWERKRPDHFPNYAAGSWGDRKSTRLNSSHGYISYAVFCLKKKKKKPNCNSLGLDHTG